MSSYRPQPTIYVSEYPVSVTNTTYTLNVTTGSLGGAWRDADTQDTIARIQRAKAKQEAQVKDVKRTVLGPKQSRWR